MQVKKGMYQHYRGNTYEVLNIVRHSETLEELVTYRATKESPEFGKDSLWARPKTMFCENITIDGKTMPRFAYISS